MHRLCHIEHKLISVTMPCPQLNKCLGLVSYAQNRCLCHTRLVTHGIKAVRRLPIANATQRTSPCANYPLCLFDFLHRCRGYCSPTSTEIIFQSHSSAYPFPSRALLLREMKPSRKCGSAFALPGQLSASSHKPTGSRLVSVFGRLEVWFALPQRLILGHACQALHIRRYPFFQPQGSHPVVSSHPLRAFHLYTFDSGYDVLCFRSDLLISSSPRRHKVIKYITLYVLYHA